MSTVKIQIDELEAEGTYEDWIHIKSKVMGYMLNGTINWEEGCAMRGLIDHALTQASAKRAQQEIRDTQTRTS